MADYRMYMFVCCGLCWATLKPLATIFRLARTFGREVIKTKQLHGALASIIDSTCLDLPRQTKQSVLQRCATAAKGACLSLQLRNSNNMCPPGILIRQLRTKAFPKHVKHCNVMLQVLPLTAYKTVTGT